MSGMEVKCLNQSAGCGSPSLDIGVPPGGVSLEDICAEFDVSHHTA